MSKAFVLDQAKALEAASQGRDAAMLLGFIVLAVVMWALLRLGDRIAAKTELKFLVRSLTAIGVLLATVGILALQQVAMEPAFQLEWALGMWVHPPIRLYTGVVFFGTLATYFIGGRRRT